jgi:excisionase family DNA binding protein
MAKKRKLNTSKKNAEKQEDKMPGYITMKEATNYLGICNQAIRFAIRRGRLPCVKTTYRIYLRKEDLDTYHQSKYSKEHLHDKHEMSVKKAAEFIGIEGQALYSLLRREKIPYFYKPKRVISILKKDVVKFKDNFDSGEFRSRIKKKVDE